MQEKLKALLDNAYAPYSNYKVSAILEMKDGKEFVGNNIENASYGATICAERSAIVSAISNGYKKGDFKKLSIMNSSNKIGTPCMICRQVFVEFFDYDMEISCYNILGENQTYLVKELCPYAFLKENLE